MHRKKALDLLHQYIQSDKMISHCLSSEAVLRAAARELNEDENKYGLAGLLHDLDVEITAGEPEKHGHKTLEILRKEGLDEEILEAIVLHNEMNGSGERTSRFHHVLAAGETITGLIFATTLVYPEKKIENVKYKSIRKRMKEKAFAASVDRDIIMECEKAGIPLDDFIRISVDAMKEISDDIGL